MSFVNRQLYKQKPSAWGPVSSVQASIFRNAERIGIPAPKAAFPLFEGSGYPRNYMSGEVGTLYGSTAPLWAIGPQGMELVWQASNTGFMFSTGIEGMTYGSNDKWSAFAIARSPGTLPSPILSPGQITYNYWHSMSIRYGISTKPLAMFEVDAYAVAATSSVDNSLFYNISIGGANYTNTLRKSWVGINGEVKVKENTSTATNRALINRLGLGIYADSTPIGYTPIINIAFLWPTWAMDDAIFYFLNDNPYFLLQRVPPVFYSVPSSSVGLYEASTSWLINATIERDSQWRINSDSSLISKWRVFEESKENTSWGIYNSIVYKEHTSWSIFNSLSNDSSWKVLKEENIETVWSVFISNIIQTQWSILSGEKISAATAWGVYNQLNLNTDWRLMALQNALTEWKIQTKEDFGVAWDVLAKADVEIEYRISEQLQSYIRWRIGDTALESEGVLYGWDFNHDFLNDPLIYDEIQRRVDGSNISI